MPQRMPRNSHPLTRLFLRGLAIVLPLALTLFLLLWLWDILSHSVFRHAGAVVTAGLRLLFGPEGEQVLPPAVRFVIAAAATVAAILLAGWWFSGLLGRRLFTAMEGLFAQVPLLRAVYPNVKQFTDFFLTKERLAAFERVVAVPYPHPGLYSIAFLTKTSLRSLNAATGRQLVSVFIPSSPMPATGYTLLAPLEDIVQLDLSVEEAIRFVIAGGVLPPASDHDQAVSDRAQKLALRVPGAPPTAAPALPPRASGAPPA